MTTSMHGQTPEHYLEVLFNARDRAATATDPVRRDIWLATVRQIELVFADYAPEIGEARDRLAKRADPEGRRMHAYIEGLMETYDAADREAREAIERARRG